MAGNNHYLELVIIGGDAVSLYPTIQEEMACLATRKAMLETRINFEGFNFKEGVRYIALENLSQSELLWRGLNRVIPRRRFKKGTRPCMTGPLPRGPCENGEEQWIFPEVKLTVEEKKSILATVAEIGVRAVFRTHAYSFGGKLYHQQGGGPIGLRATGAIARVVMGTWDKELLKLLAENGMAPELAVRYIDDIRLALQAVKPGWRWSGGQLAYKDEWQEQDNKEGISSLARTARVVKDMMNEVFNELQFTVETAEDFDCNSLPTLDTRIWMTDEGKVQYSYFEKPMSSSKVMEKMSAIGERSKVASLSQDLVRRLLNTSITLPQSCINNVIDKYSIKLLNSGYSKPQIHNIITSGLRGFEGKLRKHRSGTVKLHQSAASGKAARNRKKLTGKTDWFRKSKKQEEEQDKGMTQRSKLCSKKVPGMVRGAKKSTTTVMRTTTVLFVEQTPRGELAARLRAEEDNLAAITGFRVRIVERAGTKILNLLHKSNPWAETACSRENCYPCSTGDESDCFDRSILYFSSCNTCEKEGKEQVYVGESARSSFERGGEHIRDFQKKEEDSHIYKHMELCHQNEKTRTLNSA